VTTPPAAQTVAAGGNATFTVVATGAAPLSYQWYRNGLSLSGQTGTQLALTNIGSSDAGNYTVAVSNSSGVAVSTLATLTLSAAPTFTGASSSAGLIIAQGSTASLTVTFSAHPAPTYQWSKGGVALTGKTQATLTLTNVQPGDAGNYTVTATNTHGAATSEAMPLSVAQVPTGGGTIAISTSDGTQVNGDVDGTSGILRGGVTSGGAAAVVAPKVNAIAAKSGLFVDQGSSATLRVSVTGTPVPTLQWLKDGNTIAGATGTALTLTNIQPTDAGSYTVRATNSGGTATSDGVSLTVANLGADGSISIAAGNGQVVNGSYSSTTGVLSGGVTSGGPSAAVAPRVGGVVSKSDLLLEIGRTATLSVVATGSPVPTYRWLKDGAAITGATSSSYTIASVAAADAGRYTVQATNSAGTVTSSAVDVSVTSLTSGSGAVTIATAGGTRIDGTVESGTGALVAGVTTGATASTSVAPQIVSYSAKGGLFLNQGTTATLTARATGNPTPTYQWFKGATAIAGATSASLTLANVQPTDAATYTVRATNSGGAVTSEDVLVTVANLGTDGSVAIAGGDGRVINANYSPTTGVLGGGVTSGGAGAVVAPKLDGIVSKSDLLLEIGKPATLSIVATGSPTPTYQWFRNGTAIAGATGTTYSIASVGVSDAGSYTVVATNSAGSTTSASVGVSATTLTGGGGNLVIATSGGTSVTGTVDATTGAVTAGVTTAPAGGGGLAPAIPGLTARGGLFLNQGASATLSASASGNPSPMFQWLKDGATIAGATQASFTLNNVQPGDAALYSVRATNSAGTVTSDTVAVTVANLGADGSVAIAGGDGRVINGRFNPTTGELAGGVTSGGPAAVVAPAIEGIVSKSDILLELGKPATLTAFAGGRPAPSYQWFRDGVALTGATGANFAIASAALGDAGRYTVTATNSAGTVTSSPVEVSVTNLTSGSGALAVATAGGTRINGNVEAATGALTAGVITGVSGTTGVAPRLASVTARGGVFLEQGSSATLSASASGNPAPTFQWFKDGTAIAGATGQRLSFNNVQPTDAGSYSVRATNASGNVTSSTVPLTVASIGADGALTIASGDGRLVRGGFDRTSGVLNGGVTGGGINTVVAPRIDGIVSKSDLLLEIGKPATLSVVATGNPTPTHQWFRDGVAVTGATGTSLTLANVTRSDAGRYTVVATNSAGTVTSAAVEVSVTSLTSGRGDVVIATAGGTGIVGTVDAATGALTAGVTSGTSASATVAPQIASLSAKGGLFLNQGGNATLSASVVAHPPPTYQWLKDGVALAGSTTPNFSLTNVQPTDAGTYTVRVSNAGGTVTSEGVPVTVASLAADGGLAIAGGNGQFIRGSFNPTTGVLGGSVTSGGPNAVVAPRIEGVVSKSDLLLELGKPARFTVVATGNPPPSYQWFKDGTAIAGATADSYAIASAAVADSGAYTVRATNASGATTSAALGVSVTSLVAGGGNLTIATAGGTRIGGTVDAATGVVTAGVTTGASASAAIAPRVASLTAQGAINVEQGRSVTLVGTASGNPSPALQWLRNGIALAGQTTSRLSLPNLQPSDAGIFALRATNSGGTATSDPVQVTVIAAASSVVLPDAAPRIARVTADANAVLATRGDAVALQVAVEAEPAPTYQWLKDGAAIAGATGATLNLANVGDADVAAYTVRVSNAEGSVTSSPLRLTVAGVGANGEVSIASATGSRVEARYDAQTGALSGSVLPLAGGAVPTVQPAAITPGALFLPAGTSTVLSAFATGTPVPAFQWFKDGVAIAGRTEARLPLNNVTLADAGRYTVRATNAAGQVLSGATDVSVLSIGADGRGTLAAANGDRIAGLAPPGTVPVTPPTPGTPTTPTTPTTPVGPTTPVTPPPTPPVIVTSRLTNLSVRGTVTSPGAAIVTGFVVAGEGDRQLLVRAVGPGLTAFGVTGALPNPVLALARGGTTVAQNNGWSAGGNGPRVVAAAAAVGAFPFADGSADAAVVTPAGSGSYTLSVTGGAGTGETLVEVYDATGAAGNAGARLVNFSSSQEFTPSAQTLTAGFVVSGGTTRRVLVRAIGPTLARSFGVAGALPAPVLAVSSGAAELGSNRGWLTAADPTALAAAARQAGAFALADGAADSALILTLNPGAYNVQVRDANGASGLAMVEIYELP
jgi:hypothetical protein